MERMERKASAASSLNLGDWLHTCAPRAAGDANVRDITEICTMQVKLLCAYLLMFLLL